MQVTLVGKLKVVLYDTAAKVGWLLDGKSALLYLCRVWLGSEWAQNALTYSQDPSEYFQPHDPLRGQSSERALLNVKNRRICLFRNEARSKEYTNDGRQEWTTKTVVKSTEWTFEDLVSDIYHSLDQIDQLMRKRRNDPARVDVTPRSLPNLKR